MLLLMVLPADPVMPACHAVCATMFSAFLCSAGLYKCHVLIGLRAVLKKCCRGHADMLGATMLQSEHAFFG